jgi:hypothetical protein
VRLLGNIPCGCDSRDEVIFKAGRASWTEAALLAAGVLLVLAAFTVNQSGGQ